MPIKKELLELLVCPETKLKVAEAPKEIIEKLNAQIKSTTLKNRAGEVIEGEISEGLVREDGKLFYPIRENIPVMLIEESIALD